MMIELYRRAPDTQPPQSPVSNATGTLPEQEPTLDPQDLLGSFSSRDEALAYIDQQVRQENGVVVDTQSGLFNDYTHIEWLTTMIKSSNEQTQTLTHYLVSDEGY